MGPVKSQRRYDSSLRKEQARQTRTRMLEAAERLFADHGYASSTIETIASTAGVAVDTVYATFGSKRGLLSALMDLRVGGDDQPVELLDRAGPQAVRREPNQKRQIARFAEDVSAIGERARPVDDIIRGAAAVDAEIAGYRARLQQSRFENMRRFVSWVASNGPLRAGIGEDDAAAIVWSLTSPEMHRLLRVERAWTPERYAEWLAETLTRTLLP
ncbi:MAG TPA: helix-turn-helix domain-containing protein [Candidatus Limnocylindria bacterium]|jgi:AcrR family transcriptional regulator|nr:helix-turn-helix domain-containing protein [Candidatus Limnocylindria bacterium]